MRVLFSTTRGAGHFNPRVPFVRACVGAGHEVLVTGAARVGPQAERAGLPFAAILGLADQPLRVLVTIGDEANPAELGELRPAVRVERWVGAGGGDAARVRDGRPRRLGATLTALAWGLPMDEAVEVFEEIAAGRPR
jgi:hypothetical protein